MVTVTDTGTGTDTDAVMDTTRPFITRASGGGVREARLAARAASPPGEWGLEGWSEGGGGGGERSPQLKRARGAGETPR